jgi:hypothetical protein
LGAFRRRVKFDTIIDQRRFTEESRGVKDVPWNATAAGSTFRVYAMRDIQERHAKLRRNVREID